MPNSTPKAEPPSAARLAGALGLYFIIQAQAQAMPTAVAAHAMAVTPIANAAGHPPLAADSASFISTCSIVVPFVFVAWVARRGQA